ncbi:MAG: PIG-L deacetylase family protein [Actinomycetota bacterium]
MADVVVVVAHPDDEVLGCGATVARLSAEGHRVHPLILADGETGRPGAGPTEVEARRAAARAAAEVLGTEEPTFLDLPDQGLETRPRLELTQAIERFAEPIAPALVLTHDAGDLNLDHRVVHECTVTAFRPLPDAPWAGVATFETPSASEYGDVALGRPFAPNVFVDVTDHFETKLAAVGCYPAELRPPPHPRHPESITALARVRGATVGHELAEAFALSFARGPLLLGS